ncbi:MAG: hypothetical protein OXI53_09720 [Nitrospira sp.]|nr:hypothetical protein [Nitrospira sp.]MDE0487295.1 hypothetical protein [Nitrospira sp.]
MTSISNWRACRYADLVGLWCALGYAALAVLARRPGEPDLPAFFLIVAWTSLPVFGLYVYCHRRGELFPLGRLVLWAVVFRICGLLGGPIYEDDFYRYLWDGYRFAVTGTPYGAVPEAFFSDSGVPAIFHGILNGINYPELPTIYAPVTQIVFLLAYWLKPGSIVALQAILILIDLVTIALLLRLAPARNVMLYAWCPLVVKEIAFTAHPDGIGVCLLLAAIVLSQNHRWRSAAICLGMAVGAKIFALVLVPLVLVGAGFRHWVLFVLTLAALYAPFVIQGGTDFESLLVFAREWEFNSAAFGFLATVLHPFHAKLVLGLLCAAFWGHYYIRYCRNRTREIPRCDWLYGVLLAASPVINSWYLLWVLPFAAITPSVSAWTASVAVLLAYVTGLNLIDGELQPYQPPAWVRPVEYGLILLALAFDLFRRQSTGLGGRVSR